MSLITLRYRLCYGWIHSLENPIFVQELEVLNETMELRLNLLWLLVCDTELHTIASCAQPDSCYLKLRLQLSCYVE